MNCPACGMDSSEIIRTERNKANDRRRHVCKPCGARWTSVAKFERGSLSTPSANSDGVPIQIAPETATNSGSTGELYSDSGIRSGVSDLNPGSISNPERGRARSTQGAEFVRLLAVFTDRWQRSNRRPYPVVAADRNQLGRFMREHGEFIESFAAMCDRYLSDRRQFVIDRSGNHCLSWLVTKGLAMYGGVPRETAEQYSARVRREHEARKVAARRPSASSEMRDLISSLAEKKAVAG